MRRTLLIVCMLAAASAFAPAARSTASRLVQRNHPAKCVAKTAEDKALLASSKKVVMIAKRFGVAQGKGAQAWVEQAVKGGDARTESLVNMQLALFEECTLDDEVTAAPRRRLLHRRRPARLRLRLHFHRYSRHMHRHLTAPVTPATTDRRHRRAASASS